MSLESYESSPPCTRDVSCLTRDASVMYDAARSVEDETRNGHRNAKRTPNRNQETTIIRLFSDFQMKSDLEQ